MKDYSQVRSIIPSKMPNYSKDESVVDFRFISVTFLHVSWAVNSHVRQLWNFYQLSFPELMSMSSRQFYPIKDFQSDQIQRHSCKIFTAHYACRNADLNSTPVTKMTNGFVLFINNQFINRIWGGGGTLDLPWL